MKINSTKGHYKRLVTYAGKTFKINLCPEMLKRPAKFKSFSPAIAVYTVFSALMNGKKSASEIEKHLLMLNQKLGRVSSPCRSTLGDLLNEERTLSCLNNYLINCFRVANSLRSLRPEEFGRLTVALIDGVDIGEVYHEGGQCELCIERTHKNGDVRYFHKIVVLSVMSKYGPVPVYFRFVRPQELTVKHSHASEEKFKQECELSCARKILIELAGIFGGRLPFDILGGDALYANAPFMELTETLGSACVFVFKQENRHLYKQAKSDFCGHTLGFNVSRASWKSSYSKGRSFNSSWGFYVDVNRKGENKNVRIFETTRTETDSKTTTGMAITSDRKSITPHLVELVRAGRWHDLENGVFNSLTTDWKTLKHIFFHKINAMQSMIALQLICLVISLFYRFGNLTRGGRKFAGTLRDFFEQISNTFHSLKRKTLSDLMCNSPP